MFEEEYDIQELIGEGSYAKVYKCSEKESGNIYAVKELQIGEKVPDMEAIREEMKIWKGLQHENIVSLHRTFTDNSCFYLVCEYLDSGSLFDEIVGQKVYTEGQARSIMKQVRILFINCSCIFVLNLLHQHGIWAAKLLTDFCYELVFRVMRFLGKTKETKTDFP